MNGELAFSRAKMPGVYLCCVCGLSRGFGILEISQDCSSGWMNRLTKASIVLAGLPVSWYNSTINVLSPRV
jgi:hypothetical protein